MKNRTLLLLLLLSVAIITCSSSKGNVRNSETVIIKIEHSVTYSNKGSKSEAQHGHLFINGKEIPDMFTLLKTGNTIYSFHQRKFRWGKDGYFQVNEESETAIKKSSEKISRAILNKGWYTGNEMLADTPAEWCFVKWTNGSGYVSPSMINNLIDELNLKSIPRSSELKVLQGKE